MHDPLTVAFEIRYPWHDKPDQFFPKGYHRPFITIWHNDPESDGSDDSCGWSKPKLTKLQKERLTWLAKGEVGEPWFQRLYAKKHDIPGDAEVLLRGALVIVAQAIEARVTWGDVSLWAARLLHNPSDNYRSALCHLPGYHSNSEEDTEYWREENAKDLFFGLARYVLREKRPWWRHPRWHFWHWQLQVHPWQRLRRRFWDRCCMCGKRGFSKGEQAMGSWNGDRIWHSTCDRTAKVPAQPATG